MMKADSSTSYQWITHWGVIANVVLALLGLITIVMPKYAQYSQLKTEVHHHSDLLDRYKQDTTEINSSGPLLQSQSLDTEDFKSKLILLALRYGMMLQVLKNENEINKDQANLHIELMTSGKAILNFVSEIYQLHYVILIRYFELKKITNHQLHLTLRLNIYPYEYHGYHFEVDASDLKIPLQFCHARQISSWPLQAEVKPNIEIDAMETVGYLQKNTQPEQKIIRLPDHTLKLVNLS